MKHDGGFGGIAPQLSCGDSYPIAFRSIDDDQIEGIVYEIGMQLGKHYQQKTSLIPGLRSSFEFDESNPWATVDIWEHTEKAVMRKYIGDNESFLQELLAWGEPEPGTYHVTIDVRQDPTVAIRIANGKRRKAGV